MTVLNMFKIKTHFQALLSELKKKKAKSIREHNLAPVNKTMKQKA